MKSRLDLRFTIYMENVLDVYIVTKDVNGNYGHEDCSSLKNALTTVNSMSFGKLHKDSEIYILQVSGSDSRKYYTLDGSWSWDPFNLNLS
ncbi:hypothetical protein [Pseudoalteromonas luteoviolacea]|uniref:hypothetical protein n=1 Tax=Pseudoalteromonas luteoviolacea TaxID=43657 RepID=UPI001B38ACC8|nr:hypothetical protein [Pseudoalteromonas luteoviolacea]MBQ4836490.1 hypothetical protein [Pseudoalteromonas luteoviolacea]